jgi:hypothetical protein
VRSLLVVLLLVLVAAAVLAARTRSGRETPLPTPRPTSVPTVTVVTSSACQYRLAANGAKLPDPGCTPGAANPELTHEVLCAPSFTTRKYRHVTEAQKRRAFTRYGIVSHAAGEYEVDHLLALEDGGANDDANLWPQPAPDFHRKDLVETYIHRQVCGGSLDLAGAQQQITTDWTGLLEPAIRLGIAPKDHDDEGDEVD